MQGTAEGKPFDRDALDGLLDLAGAGITAAGRAAARDRRRLPGEVALTLAPGTTLLVATTNAGKLREIEHLLAGLPLEVRALDASAAIEPPEETGATFADNARLKARYYARATRQLAIADDSGLEIAALGGRPGVLSARYRGATYLERFDNLYRELIASKTDDRSARFVCAIALAAPDGDLAFEAEGVVDGVIAPAPRGSGALATTRSSSIRRMAPPWPRSRPR